MPSGRRRPPVAPADNTTGSTGSTHGETAVAAPATSAKRTSSAMRIQVSYARRRVTDERCALTRSQDRVSKEPAASSSSAHAQSAVGALEEAQERFDDQWVELRAGSALELLARTGGADAHPVSAVGDHRLVGVGHRQDARLRRDLAALEPCGVARPIWSLVVREQ